MTHLGGSRPAGDVESVRLRTADLPEVSALLKATWPALYEKNGCPDYSADYLRWAYGGPHADRHYLAGFRWRGRLVAYQGFLFRRVTYRGALFQAYLNTHATISPNLEWGLRCTCSAEMLRQHVLYNGYVPDCDLIISFFDDDKKIRASGDKILKQRHQTERHVSASFQHHAILVGTLERSLMGMERSASAVRLRCGTPEDLPELAALYRQLADSSMIVREMDTAELGHCLFGDPAHHTMLAERDGVLRAFMHWYSAGFVRGPQRYSYVLIEHFVNHPFDAECAALLLQEAVKTAKGSGAKGVVMENATYLDGAAYRPLGLMPTFRRMTMTVVAKYSIEPSPGRFLCDVK